MYHCFYLCNHTVHDPVKKKMNDDDVGSTFFFVNFGIVVGLLLPLDGPLQTMLVVALYRQNVEILDFSEFMSCKCRFRFVSAIELDAQFQVVRCAVISFEKGTVPRLFSYSVYGVYIHMAAYYFTSTYHPNTWIETFEVVGYLFSHFHRPFSHFCCA